MARVDDRAGPQAQHAPPSTAAPGEWRRGVLVRRLAQAAGLSDVCARDMEVGVFNYALAYATEHKVLKNWGNPRFVAVYQAKARSVLCNITPGSYVGNAGLLQRLRDGEFAPHEVAAMRPEETCPERWQSALDVKLAHDRYMSTAKPTAMTDQFQCKRCKGRECVYQEIQLRSSDEPMSIFVTCLSCALRWRIG
jgi:DNA-directed RNA polymerase subunit M/transcription elongation factor TFIIS